MGTSRHNKLARYRRNSTPVTSRRQNELVERTGDLSRRGYTRAVRYKPIGRVGPPFPSRLSAWQLAPGKTDKWRYAHAEVQLSGDVWVTKPGGRSGTVTTNYALNMIEANNAGTGVRGNSVNKSGPAYPTGFALKPVGAGSGGTVAHQVIVFMQTIRDATGAVRYVFAYENSDDGPCS